MIKDLKNHFLQLINRGESESVEFKTSFDKETIETLCAFANTKGGSVFIGVNDHGEISGTQIGHETLHNGQTKSSWPPHRPSFPTLTLVKSMANPLLF